MIDRKKVVWFASQAGVDLRFAEKEVVLVYALDWLRAREILPHLAFKGGTFLRKMVLGDAGRFSEDLDFNAISPQRTAVDKLLKLLPDAKRTDTHEGVTFCLQNLRDKEESWAADVHYKHSWDSDTFGLEISYREVPWLPIDKRKPLDQRYFVDLPFDAPSVPCMGLPEAMAEKIRAVQQRTQPRDLYDLIEYVARKPHEDLVRLLAAVKLWRTRDRFRPVEVLAKLNAGFSDWSDLDGLVGRRRRRDWNKECQEAAGRLAFLADLTKFEHRLIADFQRHEMESDILPEISRVAARKAPSAPRGRG